MEKGDFQYALKQDHHVVFIILYVFYVKFLWQSYLGSLSKKCAWANLEHKKKLLTRQHLALLLFQINLFFPMADQHWQLSSSDQDT